MAAAASHSLLQVLYDRYGSTDTEGLQITINIPKSASGKSGSEVLILPRTLGLNVQHIDHIGDLIELRKLCKSVTDIDLSGNQLCDWLEVVSMVSAMPRLQFLNVSNNPLCKGESVKSCLSSLNDDQEVPSYNNLTSLILNNLGISWDDVWELLKLFPCVRELHLGVNNFSSVKPPPDGAVFPKVKEIFLNGNFLSDPEQLVLIGQIFPELEHIVMIRNPIEKLISDADLCASAFPHVNYLNISQSSVTEWAELEKLRHWPKLNSIRLQEIPLLLRYSEVERRQLTIGYLPSAECLNGSPIPTGEREDAERAFIRYYMDKEEKPARYDELHTVYGDLDPLVEVNMNASCHVTLPVHFGDKSVLKQLNLNWTLAETKQFLQDFSGLPAKQMVLYHRDAEAPYGDDRMMYDQRTLLRYRVKEGDEIVIDHGRNVFSHKWKPAKVSKEND